MTLHNPGMSPADPDRVAVLLSTYLFEDLSPAELEPLARSTTLRRLARGEYVSHVGDPADSLFVVASGQIKDSIVTEDGDELVHSFFGTGMVIGEPGFFAAERNRVMALVTVEPSTVLVLERDRLMPFLERHPRVITRALEGLASIARGQTEIIAALARRPLQDRLLLRLLELAETNERRADGAGVTPKISQATLAAMVGVSRENVNRALAALAAEGAVQIEAGRYVIGDPEEARRRAAPGWPLVTKPNRRTDLSSRSGA
ncbi:MAG: Crp/Fnr family transcriptional regulator [Actinomycetota bacterium]